MYSKDDRTQVRRQLTVLANSPTFAGAPQLAKLLAYLVAAELDGTGHELNQTRIAMDVLGRSKDFDVATDAIVRVEAGRLRAKLSVYYACEGAHDPIRFDVPKGRYSPKIHFSSSLHLPVGNQKIRFLKSSDGTSLAYAVSGSGKPLVKAANWLSHLEFDHQSPIWRHWWDGLSSRCQLIRYDERGCGLSDWDVAFSFDAWVEDLEAVIERTGVDDFALLGISQGAAVAVAYAVRHPEKVSHLILYGGFLQGRLMRDVPESKKEEARTLESLARIGWGREDAVFRNVFGSLFMPGATPEQLASFDALQRVSTSPENAGKFLALFNEIDVVELAERVRTPTLVLHARDEIEIPASQARLIATSIPNSRLALLDSRNHIIGEKEPAWQQFLRELDAFLGE